MADTNKPLTKNPPKVFDVFRPGKVAAPATSRPVIVGHQPKVQDSTLTDKPTEIVGVPERELLDSHDKVAVQPPESAEASAAALPTDGGAAPAQPVPSGSAAEPAAEPESIAQDNEPQTTVESEPASAQTPDEHIGQPAISATAVTDEPQPPAETQTSPTPESDQKSYLEHLLAEHAEPALPESSNAGQVVVSHHRAARRMGTGVWLIALLVIIVLVILADALLDTGILKSTAIPHTHFIR